MIKESKNKFKNIIYEIVISVLALIAVIISVLDITGRVLIEAYSFLYWTDISILLIFTLDYFVRLLYSNNKILFFKENILELIAIIPFSSIFRVLRIARLFKLVKIVRITKVSRFIRLFAFGGKLKKKFDKFFKTNGFIYVLYLTVIVIVLGSIGIYFIEKGKTISSFSDAVWWSFVTATTVGYGDISPSTGLGRIVAAILMIVGIGFIGMLTGTIATYFINGINNKSKNISMQERILDLSDLDDEKFENVLVFIDYIRNK